jgi:hypothetical protein
MSSYRDFGIGCTGIGTSFSPAWAAALQHIAITTAQANDCSLDGMSIWLLQAQ